MFGKGRHIYTFENRCIQDTSLSLGDDTIKIILNTKGTMDDVPPELKSLLDFIDGEEPRDEFTKELEAAVKTVRKNEKWRLDYMTLQMNYQEKYEQGIEQGNKQSAVRRIKAGKLSSEEISTYTGLTIEQIVELEKELHCNSLQVSAK